MNFKVSEEEARQIEFETREQLNSPKWFEARRLRLTVSLFGRVKQLNNTWWEGLGMRLVFVCKYGGGGGGGGLSDNFSVHPVS